MVNQPKPEKHPGEQVCGNCGKMLAQHYWVDYAAHPWDDDDETASFETSEADRKKPGHEVNYAEVNRKGPGAPTAMESESGPQIARRAVICPTAVFKPMLGEKMPPHLEPHVTQEEWEKAFQVGRGQSEK